MTRTKAVSAAIAITVASAFQVLGQGAYDTGATDEEIFIGVTAPLTGPASSYGIACAAHEPISR